MTESAPLDQAGLGDEPDNGLPRERPETPLRSVQQRARTLRAPLHLGLLGAGFMVLLAIMAISIWLLDESSRVANRVARTLTVTNLLAELGADLRRAESGQRGFLLTGDGGYLEDYNAVVGQIEPSLQQLLSLSEDEPERRQQLEALRPMINAKLAEMESTIQLAIEGDRSAAADLIGSDRGLKLMTDIAESLSLMRLAERQLLSARLVAADHTQTQLLVVSMAGILVIVFLASLSIFAVRRSTQHVVEAHAALAATNQELEWRVAVRTQDLQEANDEIQRFAYIVGHDLRAPLVNVMGFTSELASLRDRLFADSEAPAPIPMTGKPDEPGEDDQTLREEFDESLDFIKSSIAKMDRLIQAILQLSRAGRREFKTEAINLNSLVGSIVDNFSHRLTQQGVEIEVERLPAVASDRLALDQVFSNLIDNALKYLRPDVPGRIEVTGRETDDSVEIAVVDNGRGIGDKDRERIFELFRRAGNQDQAGEGIGLAHVRMLVRRLGGTIAVDSTPGAGSRFTVTLPKRWSP